MTFNVTLAERTLQHIIDRPEEWNQAFYRCGTSMCFAGHAVTLDGGRWVSPSPHGMLGSYLFAADADRAWAEGHVATDQDALEEQGHVHVYDRARRVLGLTMGQANQLFGGDNSLDDLRAIVAHLKSESEAS